jgi:serine protein kinase
MELMSKNDFKTIITDQRIGKGSQKWEGNTLDYLQKVMDDPGLTRFAPGRIYDMVAKYGFRDVDSSLKTRGYEDLIQYKFFDGKIFGTFEAIHDIMRFLKAAARRTETGKRILIMVGPVSSGKSTIAYLIKRGLERDDSPVYAIEGCPIQEDPLHLIPNEDREFWEEKLGVRIEGELCPVCQLSVDTEYSDEDGNILWENVPVEQFKFSEQRRKGIGTFQPSDPKSQDISELIGSVNMAKLTLHGETDPRAYQFDGELQISNRGIVEYIEILKADVKFHYVLITAAQEQLIKAPRFPQMSVDTLILSHTNQTEYDSFKADKKNEALHDRMYPIMVPYNLRVDDEIKIYDKLIKESEFANIHIAPGTLRIAAQFAILSRLIESTKVTNFIEKMKLYNGETTEEFKKQEIDLKALRLEGREQDEGMFGISPRFIINALNIALGSKEDKNCVNPIDIIRALRQNFEHQIGISEEDQGRFLNLLIGEKDSVSFEYKQFAKKQVNIAFLYAYEEQANTLFDNYMQNAAAFCKKEKVYDSITGEYSDPDEKLMRSIEELIGVPVNSRTEFRNGIFVYKTDCMERGETFTFASYTPLKEAIEKKLMSDLKNVVTLTIADKTSTDERKQKRREKAFRKLVPQGREPKSHEDYCEHCANMLLAFIGEVLRKEE